MPCQHTKPTTQMLCCFLVLQETCPSCNTTEQLSLSDSLCSCFLEFVSHSDTTRGVCFILQNLPPRPLFSSSQLLPFPRLLPKLWPLGKRTRGKMFTRDSRVTNCTLTKVWLLCSCSQSNQHRRKIFRSFHP